MASSRHGSTIVARPNTHHFEELLQQSFLRFDYQHPRASASVQSLELGFSNLSAFPKTGGFVSIAPIEPVYGTFAEDLRLVSQSAPPTLPSIGSIRQTGSAPASPLPLHTIQPWTNPILPSPVDTDQEGRKRKLEIEELEPSENGGNGHDVASSMSTIFPSFSPLPPATLGQSYHEEEFVYASYHGLTEEQQAQEDADAAEQAEGGIIADHATDAGYESDDASTASTSISSSVRDFSFENGRRYHKFREGRYNFPNDDSEQEREDMKHTMVTMLCQQLHFAPIGDDPHEILDIGTGTGAWAIEMGDAYPSANVLGIDLSPIQPDWVPPNVRFMVDDVESAWLHPRNHFDFIHSRHTVMAIRDWDMLLRRAHEHLKPGGWVELQEIYHFPMSGNNTPLAEHPVYEYWRHISEGLKELGVNFEFSGNGQIAELMRHCGYTNVTERVFHVPIGTWPKNRKLKSVGLYWKTILLDGAQAIALGPMTRGLKWSPEQVELFLVSVRKAYHDNSCLMYMPLVCVYGQKPGYGV